MKRSKNGLVILMIIIDLLILIFQSGIVILMFIMYSGSELTRTQDKIVIISCLFIVINEIFLLMKFHSNWKDCYKAKLKRGLTLRVFVVLLNFVGIILHLDIGNSMRKPEALDLFRKYEKGLIAIGCPLGVLLIVSMSLELLLKGRSKYGGIDTLKSDIEEIKGILDDQKSFNE